MNFLQDYKSALPYWEQVASQKKAFYCYELARILWYFDRKDEALNSLKEALKCEGINDELQKHIIDLKLNLSSSYIDSGNTNIH